MNNNQQHELDECYLDNIDLFYLKLITLFRNKEVFHFFAQLGFKAYV